MMKAPMLAGITPPIRIGASALAHHDKPTLFARPWNLEPSEAYHDESISPHPHRWSNLRCNSDKEALNVQSSPAKWLSRWPLAPSSWR